MATVRHLGFVWRSHETTHEGQFTVQMYCNKDLDFSQSGLKVLFTPQNFIFWGVWPQNLWQYRSPKGTSLHETTHFEPSLVQIWRAVRPVPCAPGKNSKKKKKRKRHEDCAILGVRPDHPRCHISNPTSLCGVMPQSVFDYQQNQPKEFGAPRGQKSTFPYWRPVAYNCSLLG